MIKTRLQSGLILSLLSLLVFLILGTPLTAHALWPFSKFSHSQTTPHTPPPADAMETTCDPIRQKVVRLNQKNKLIHPFYRPRIGHLKNKYNRCTQTFRDQEYEYLKHAQVRPNQPPLGSQEESKKTQPSPNLTPLKDPRLKKNAEHGLDPSLFGKNK